MPQWAGSCWYYLRYLDPGNDQALFDEKAYEDWMPVDLYVGGSEHAVLHLLYARFWHKVLFDVGVVKHPEPFQKLVHQGMMLGTAYRLYAVVDVRRRSSCARLGDAARHVVPIGRGDAGGLVLPTTGEAVEERLVPLEADVELQGRYAASPGARGRALRSSSRRWPSRAATWSTRTAWSRSSEPTACASTRCSWGRSSR